MMSPDEKFGPRKDRADQVGNYEHGWRQGYREGFADAMKAMMAPIRDFGGNVEVPSRTSTGTQDKPE